MLFKGLYTALITPFTDDGDVDFAALESLLEAQIEAGVDGIVALGTTAENPTLSSDEYIQIAKLAKRYTEGNCKLVIGSGSNSTTHTVEQSKLAERFGADGLLVVNPYYNKPMQEGLYQHFVTVADNVGIPVMLYNHPGRTAVNLEGHTLRRLVAHPNIVSLKEANDDMSQIMSDIDIAQGNDFSVLSGNDSVAYSLIKDGGHGVISIVSNLLPKEFKQLIDAAMSGDFKEAQKHNNEMLDLMNALSAIGTNPIAVKTLLAYQGKIRENFRLPLTTLPADLRKDLINIFEAYHNG